MKPIKMKPILFNGEMVRAILDGRKTQTRRVLKISSRTQNIENRSIADVKYPSKNICGICADCYDVNGFWRGAAKPSYQPGDILYVRETYGYGVTFADEDTIYFRADNASQEVMQWIPSIHMPKDLARIFLHVTDVRVARLQNMTLGDIFEEGSAFKPDFINTWERTLHSAAISQYGWVANPWVWVYTFERLFDVEGKDE